MDEAKWVELIGAMEMIKSSLEALKQHPDVDAHAMSVAITNLETSMLWVANARK